ncbi:MAG: hypothetical protein COB67_00245 [SAR324 cluster bacterium]|uniref:Conjugal transfer protein TraB n=1 Tax=SAR324 cluster bacterium TaxID=2024889 RepID=A0A2A4TC81_9DELT|nr:MAG: hypothetical protein COB67_00245 [SAR324 cluster bacterium]
MSQEKDNNEQGSYQENKEFTGSTKAWGDEEKQEKEVDKDYEEAKKIANENNITAFEPIVQMFAGIAEFFSTIISKVLEKINTSKPSFAEKREMLEKEECNIDTIEQTRKKKERSVRNRFIALGLFIPAAMLVTHGLVKGWFNYLDIKAEEKIHSEYIAKHHKSEMKLSKNNLENIWKINVQNDISDAIKLSTESKIATEKIQTETLARMEEMHKENVNNNAKTINAIIKDNNNTKHFLNNKFETLKDTMTKMIKKSEKKMFKKIVENAQIASVVPNKQEQGVNFLPLSPTFNSSSTNSILEDEEMEEYTLEVVEAISFSDIDGSTLDFLESNDQNKSLIEFILQAGFAKGRIITGTISPTSIVSSEGQENLPEPVFISMMSPLKIANGFYEDISDCLIRGVAKGDFSTGRAKIRLEELSCSMETIDGEMYYIHQKVEGWVFGEDGYFGAKGRLITKEGQIVSKALPLGMLEGLIGALTQSPQLLVPGATGTTSGSSVVQQGAIQGFSSGSTKVIEKISDYYIKLLNSLNPTVEVRAGRVVTIGFRGGEKIKVQPYKSFNIGAFSDLKKGDIDEAYLR